MALHIGFSTVFYTLWDVNNRIDYDRNNRPTEKTYYHYLKNLSKDEMTAISKAKNEGCVFLTPDKELHGRNTDFFIEKKLYCDFTAKTAPYFFWGKYIDTPIFTSNDIKYLYWYYTQTSNLHVLRRLNKLNYTIFDGNLILTTDLEKEVANKETAKKFADEIFNSLEIILTPEKNLNDNGVLVYERENNVFRFQFQDYKIMTYNDYLYALPTIKNVGKKIKGKQLRLKLECMNQISNYYNIINWEFV